MKTKTLEDALFDTGAPDEIILLAMVEACDQDVKFLSKTQDILKYNYDTTKEPFRWLVSFEYSKQGHDFWSNINQLYRIR